MYNIYGFMLMWNPAVHHQGVCLDVPEGDLVYSDIDETSLYEFV